MVSGAAWADTAVGLGELGLGETWGPHGPMEAWRVESSLQAARPPPEHVESLDSRPNVLCRYQGNLPWPSGQVIFLSLPLSSFPSRLSPTKLQTLLPHQPELQFQKGAALASAPASASASASVPWSHSIPQSLVPSSSHLSLSNFPSEIGTAKSPAWERIPGRVRSPDGQPRRSFNNFTSCRIQSRYLSGRPSSPPYSILSTDYHPWEKRREGTFRRSCWCAWGLLIALTTQPAVQLPSAASG